MNELISFARTVYLDLRHDLKNEEPISDRGINLMREAEKILGAYAEEMWRQYRLTFEPSLRLLENVEVEGKYRFRDGEIVELFEYGLDDDGLYIMTVVASEGEKYKIPGEYLEAVEDDEYAD